MSEQPSCTTRREFLAGGLTFVSAASALPIFLGKTAEALAGLEPDGRRGGDADRVLVVVRLAGGNDGLNTVIPYEQDPYYRYRRRLAIPRKSVLKLGDGLGLHPAATGLKELFDDGKMAIVQGVGYPSPNRNHFASTESWHTADPTLKTPEGWLGRYFDVTCNGADLEPIRGVALMKEVPLALRGKQFTALAVENPEELTWRACGHDQAASVNLGSRPGGFDGHTQLGRSLELVARMIAADLPTRVYYVSMSGFDTHTNQEGRHRRLLRDFGDALKGFIDTLSKNKLLDRVLVMTFSEFGRRVQENAAGGTDHGEAAPLFLFGSKLRPGIHEKHPSLDDLHRGDLAFDCDFRRVYAAILCDWLGVRASLVLPGNFAPLRLIRPS